MAEQWSLEDGVLIGDMKSCWQSVTSGVPQQSVLDIILFDIFVNNPKVGGEYLQQFYVTKLGGVADMPEGCAAIQEDLDRLTGTVGSSTRGNENSLG